MAIVLLSAALPSMRAGLAAMLVQFRHVVVDDVGAVDKGLPNKGIARRLGITENTAKFHVAALKAKLGASSRTEAVALGARWGIIVL